MLANLLCIQVSAGDLTREADPPGYVAKGKNTLETAFGEILPFLNPLFWLQGVNYENICT